MKNHADAMIFHTAICEKNFILERSQIDLMARRRRTKRSRMGDFYEKESQGKGNASGR